MSGTAGLHATPVIHPALTPVEILRTADRARGNHEGISWTVSVTALEDGKEEKRTISVQARGFDMLAETRAPANQKGQKLLLVKRNMWFHKPGISKPVPVSLRQKLMGRAANGDIAATNYAEDFDIESVTESELDGTPCYQFELVANSKKTTYARIRYWITRENLVGIRADYYTKNGDKRIKTARLEYDNTVDIDGAAQPFISSMTIAEELTSQTRTVLEFSDPTLGVIPDRAFNVNLLGR